MYPGFSWGIPSLELKVLFLSSDCLCTCLHGLVPPIPSLAKHIATACWLQGICCLWWFPAPWYPCSLWRFSDSLHWQNTKWRSVEILWEVSTGTFCCQCMILIPFVTLVLLHYVLVVSLLLCLLAFEFEISDDGLKFKADVLNSFVDYVINLGSSCLVAKAFILLYSDS